MKSCSYSTTKLINFREVNHYYLYLLDAFKHEFSGSSRRELIEEIASGSKFSLKEAKFLREIVANAFDRKDPYKKSRYGSHQFQHPIELLDYIVSEGYTPSSPFVVWAHKKLGVRWNAMHWFRFLMRDIAPVDLELIREEMKKTDKFHLPQTLEFYYRLGSGLERITVNPDLGVRSVIKAEYEGVKKYKGFDPIDYLDYYYGGLDREDMTIAKTFYTMLLENRKKLPSNSVVLIVGNGPVPDEAQALSMISEIRTIIPSDVDPRNIEIMRRHTGRRNPLATQKARPGEEHADFIYYLFERYTKVNFGFFAVREITAVKTEGPVYGDVSKENPLNISQNSSSIKKLKADLVVVPFCPESITDSMVQYRSYITNISNLVGSKRHLCMLALKNANYYIYGAKKLVAVPIDENIVCNELIKNGFINIQIVTIKTGLDRRKRGFSDSMVIWADKK